MYFQGGGGGGGGVTGFLWTSNTFSEEACVDARAFFKELLGHSLLPYIWDALIWGVTSRYAHTEMVPAI